MAPQPLPTNAQRNRGLGSGSAAGILAAIPVDNSTQPPRQDSAGLRSRPTVCLGFLFGWPRRRGRSAASWPCHTEGMGWRESLQEWLGGWPLSQVRRCPQKEAGALCVSTACVCLKTWPAQEPAGSCSHLKGPASGSLSKASVRGSSSLPFRCWPGRWTGCHCSQESEGGVSGQYQVCQAGRCECVLCVYATVCLGSCHCCNSVLLSAS